ncbi:MAG: KamA family radical SAM protein [Planctomycetota bacterium]|nr:KamA family radical SAM protein [Planctomycetota bacterium]
MRECIRVFRSIIGPINEYRTPKNSSALKYPLAARCEKPEQLDSEPSVAFLMEFIHIFRGIAGNSNIYEESRGVRKGIPEFLKLHGREAATKRMSALDETAAELGKYFKKFPSGLDDEVRQWRKDNADRIKDYYGATDEDWNDWHWHVRNVIKDPKPLFDLIELTQEQRDAVEKSVQNKIPFGITPFYLSLMERPLSIGFDHAIRAQVIPPPDYVDIMAAEKGHRSTLFDFMGEHDTSPVDLVTRRYPGICIIKPFNTCSQICVYCQRNWEIDECLAPNAMAEQEVLDEALDWLDNHKGVGDVLVTGGDPSVMSDERMEYVLSELAKKPQVYRIRIGTRTPVVLPTRWTDEYVKMIARYHEPPKREIAIVTHFEHSYEITPEAMQTVPPKTLHSGIKMYNQEVFTAENSRRFESAKLRLDLRKIGIDPYYTFNMKGKEETRRYMVPIARILQERKEEARLLPGLDRTDEPVFNVPKLGKNHLRSWQDHRLVMIKADGSRVYEFHPWEKNITPVPPYNYSDVPIYEYLEELAARGENIRDYRTIWYYY